MSDLTSSASPVYDEEMTTNESTKTIADAVTLWEDVVGDSGKAPTDSELFTFFNAVREQAAAEVDAHTQRFAEAGRRLGATDGLKFYMDGAGDASAIVRGERG